MTELEEWFRQLGEHLQAASDRPLAPTPADIQILLDLGKVAAETGPQRYYALLTAFAVGRALGRAEVKGEIATQAFLEAALRTVRAMGEAAQPPM